ncbi:unnamed protein product [Soboliphyme baturini]|uniref:PINc domain-containing protein n=1 Tax=Soboliphyme baturini TaxID=241478 RepID=A0A183IEN6_9BILA|nr:unnamed protein product [Soboliphyme baturini]
MFRFKHALALGNGIVRNFTMNQEKVAPAVPSGETAKTAVSNNVMTPEFRKLYRTCVECVKRLDQSTKDKNSVREIFLPQTIAVATKLRCCCEKIMRDCSVDISRQAEDLVWKKCFYEPIQHVRKCKKINAFPSEYETTYAMLLSSAIGYYSGLLSKLQMQCHIDLEQVIDFPFVHKDPSRTTGEIHVDPAKAHLLPYSQLNLWCSPGSSFLMSMPYSIAFHVAALGGSFNVCSQENFEGSCSNLNQLLNENQKVFTFLTSTEGCKNLRPHSEYKLFLVTYLHVFQIFYRDEETYDQGTSLQDICQRTIGLFEVCLRQSLLNNWAMARKMRSEQFDAVLLLKIIVMQMLVIKKLADSAAIAWLLSIFSNLLTCSTDFLNGDLFPKPEPLMNGFIKETTEGLALEEKTDMAEKTDGSAEKSGGEEGDILRRRRHGSDGSEDDWRKSNNNSSSSSMDDEDGNKSSCTDVLTSSGPCGMMLLFGNIPSFETPVFETAESGNVLLNGAKSVCSDDAEDRSATADSSEVCETNCVTMSSQDVEHGMMNSLKSQLLLCDPLENGASLDSEHSGCGQKRHVRFKMAGISFDNGLLRTYRQRESPAEKLNFLVTFDWLLVMKTSKIIWSHLAFFLNLLPNDEQLMKIINDDEELSKILSGSVWAPISDWYQKTPLPEDVHLRGVSPLSQTFSSLDYTKPVSQSKMCQVHRCSLDKVFKCVCCFSSGLNKTVGSWDRYDKIKVIIRIYYIRSFGHYLIRLNTPEFHFDRSRMEFVACLGRTLMQNVEEDKKSELMRIMAKLKLKDDLAHVNRTYWVPVYLVPDTSALCNKLSLIKQLAMTQKFVTVVPNMVIRELDKLKKETGPAREATRWIESQFQRASKFVRVQKLTETSDWKPNFADEEVGWILYENSVCRSVAEIMRCCAYLSQTVPGCNNTTVVTLLTNHTMGSVAFQRLTMVSLWITFSAFSIDGKMCAKKMDETQRKCWLRNPDHEWAEMLKISGTVIPIISDVELGPTVFDLPPRAHPSDRKASKRLFES